MFCYFDTPKFQVFISEFQVFFGKKVKCGKMAFEL